MLITLKNEDELRVSKNEAIRIVQLLSKVLDEECKGYDWRETLFFKDPGVTLE